VCGGPRPAAAVAAPATAVGAAVRAPPARHPLLDLLQHEMNVDVTQEQLDEAIRAGLCAQTP